MLVSAKWLTKLQEWEHCIHLVSWYHIRTRPEVYSNVSSSLHLNMAP